MTPHCHGRPVADIAAGRFVQWMRPRLGRAPAPRRGFLLWQFNIGQPHEIDQGRVSIEQALARNPVGADTKISFT